jgi:hypothetical protein
VLTKPGTVLPLEGTEFLDPALESCSIDLTLALKFDNLGLGRGDQIISLDPSPGRVLFSRALGKRKHGHGLLVDVLNLGRRCRWCGSSRYSGCLSGGSDCTGRSLLCGRQASTKFSILALKGAEFEFDLIEERIHLVHLVATLALGSRELLIAYVLRGQGHPNHTLSSTYRREVT